MFSFHEILMIFKNIFTAIYTILDSIYLFEEFHVSVFWMAMGLVVAGVIWRIIAHFGNFGEDDEVD